MTDWPQELRKERVLANFKPPKRDRLKKKARASDKRPGMSEEHLALIRKMPCCVTLKVPAGECHHIKSGTGERGIGLRSTDRWAVPLSHEKHMELERVGSRNEVKWFHDHGIDDPHALAAALWSATGDLPRMVRILMAHRQGKESSRNE